MGRASKLKGQRPTESLAVAQDSAQPDPFGATTRTTSMRLCRKDAARDNDGRERLLGITIL
jgi:hypothetical protein